MSSVGHLPAVSGGSTGVPRPAIREAPLARSLSSLVCVCVKRLEIERYNDLLIV